VVFLFLFIYLLGKFYVSSLKFDVFRFDSAYIVCWMVLFCFSVFPLSHNILARFFEEWVVLQVVGDDLLMSNPKRIQRAIEESTCNAVLLKVFSHLR
jgi:hypothetical protein